MVDSEAMTTVIPLKGDRSAHDALAYPTKHASDLEAGTPVYHVPVGAVVGQTVRWDGTKWVAYNNPLTVLGTMEGAVIVGASPFKLYNRFGSNRTITEIFLSVSAAPTGVDLIVDIKVDGVSIFSGSLASITDGSLTGVQTTINAPTWASGSYLTWEVTQKGSTASGENLTVHITHQG
jgi:hypothetical protein